MGKLGFMRISIVAHNAYGMISGTPKGHIGGVERQAAMLARWLVERGHGVSLITWNEGGPPVEVIDRIRVIKICRPDAGLPVVRFFVPRWSSLNGALRMADADLYYQNGAEEVTGQVALWCRRHERKFVFSTASDIDCSDWFTSSRALRERLLYRHGLKLADRIIVQTNTQAALLKSATHLGADVLPMPGDDFARCRGTHPGPGDDEPPLLLMVGRIAPEKNVEMFIELARMLPHMRFLVAGPGDPSSAYVAGLRKSSLEVSNLEFFGSADRQQLCDLYRAATALCCTSHYEGFPNTFIEAWSLGLPVISTIDPDGVISRHGLGAHVSTLDDLRDRVRQLADSREQRDAIAESAQAYFRSHHQLDVAMERFERLFQETV
jgi:glycosyltransferase involved in cell wall biosynthesis